MDGGGQVNANGTSTLAEVFRNACQIGFAGCSSRWLMSTISKSRLNSRNARGSGNKSRRRVARIYSS